MKNNGYTDLEYSFGDDKELNERLSKLINEFCHVFHCHADGNWKNHDKPAYAKLLAKELEQQPSLIRKLLLLKDPVVDNVTYEAIEITKNAKAT